MAPPCTSTGCARTSVRCSNPMAETSGANVEMAVVLPLGVVANQLMKIETDLRLLNMKALDFAQEREEIGRAHV